MTTAAQKDEEIFALQRFWAACSEDVGNYCEESEAPDFIFLPSGIGLEVMELVRPASRSGSTERSQEAYHEGVLEAASRLFAEARPYAFVEVHAIWGGDPGRRIKPYDLAAALARYVIANTPAVRHGYVEADYPDLRAEPLLAETLVHLSVVRLDPGPSFWNAGAGTAPDLYPDELQTYVSKKEPKVQAIRKKVDQAWLLIYAPGHLASNHVIIHVEAAAHRYKTSFDRVFVMDWWTWEHLLELHIEIPV